MKFETNMRQELMIDNDYSIIRMDKNSSISVEKITYKKGMVIKKAYKTAYLTGHENESIRSFIKQCWRIDWNY